MRWTAFAPFMELGQLSDKPVAELDEGELTIREVEGALSVLGMGEPSALSHAIPAHPVLCTLV